MPDLAAEPLLLGAHKIYAPTELGGMMGYLTAVEEYLAKVEGVPFDINTLLVAAQQLDAAGFSAARRVKERGYRESFEEAVTAIYA
jgi:cyclopropane fatty-acyl-phospholipid synthase-like methyltransferase